MDVDTFAILFLLVFLGFILFIVFFAGYTRVISDNKAQTICVSKGYETFVSYTKFPVFGVTPHALVCGSLTQRMIYEGKIIAYNVNGNRSIILSKPN